MPEVHNLRQRRPSPSPPLPSARGDGLKCTIAKKPVTVRSEADAPVLPPSGDDDEHLSFCRLLPALLVALALSAYAGAAGLWDLAESVLVATVRTAVQMSCLGAILSPLFELDRAAPVLGYVLLFMLPLAAYETSARSSLTHPGVYISALCGLGSSVISMTSVALFGVLRPRPWYSARHVVPLAGMILSNSLTGTSLALDRLLDELRGPNAAHVELLLSFGAAPREAVWPSLSKVTRQAMAPTLNSMNVMGLVAIPGMMTGQILGGSSPVKAARHQIMIMCLIAGGTAMSVGISCTMTVRDSFDARGVFLVNKIVPQTSPRISQLLQASSSGKLSSLEESVAKSKSEQFFSVVMHAELMENNDSDGALLAVDVQGKLGDGRPLLATFSLYSGEVATLMGPSGVGKSTLLKAIAELSGAGALDYDEWSTGGSSSIRLRGLERSTYVAHEWRRRVLYVPQGQALSLLGTPREFIQRVQALDIHASELGKDSALSLEAVVKLLEQWGLAPDRTLDRPWTELSGGEAQRTLLAVAIATNPEVLLLDEPTSALDDRTKEKVEDSLRWSGCATLLVTHDEDQAKRFGNQRFKLVEEAVNIDLHNDS